MARKESSPALTPSPRRPFVSHILQAVAPRIGAQIVLEPEFGFVGEIIFKHGRRVLFRDRNFNVNPAGSAEIARDKGYADYFLRRAGFPILEGRTFFSDRLNDKLPNPRTIDDGYDYSRALGWPVILKPNNLSQGTLVTKVHDRREFYSVARAILGRVPVLLVQRFYPGRDFRLVVLDDAVISAYERIPLGVVGDGRATIRQLLHQKREHFITREREADINLRDPRIPRKLRRCGLTLSSVPAEGEAISLLDNANLSTGGECRDVTTGIHQGFVSTAVAITKVLGLRLCGVDLMVQGSLEEPPGDFVVLEVNGAPGLDNYASTGRAQEERVEELYLGVLKALERG